jgi:hypothetical protein
MKLGRALLLYGELVDAAECDHDDTVQFMIVCPICAEPVFRVARVPNPYFAHHRGHPDDCELRCARIGMAAVEDAAATARGQTLAAFLGRFRDVIAELCADDQPGRSAAVLRGRFERLMRTPSLGWFADGWVSTYAGSTSVMGRRGHEDLAVYQPKMSGLERARLLRLIADVYEHLASRKAGPNRRYLAVAAAAFGLWGVRPENEGHYDAAWMRRVEVSGLREYEEAIKAEHRGVPLSIEGRKAIAAYALAGVFGGSETILARTKVVLSCIAYTPVPEAVDVLETSEPAADPLEYYRQHWPTPPPVGFLYEMLHSGVVKLLSRYRIAATADRSSRRGKLAVTEVDADRSPMASLSSRGPISEPPPPGG